MTVPEKMDFLLRVFKAWIPFLRGDSAWFVWHASQTHTIFEQALQSLGLLVHQQIIWVKPISVMSYSKYFYRHEPCLFGWMEGHKPYFKNAFFGGDNNTVWIDAFANAEPADVMAQVLEHSTVWDIDFEGKKRPGKSMHPTQKPIELFARPMRNHTRADEICCEPFSGSGSQILAGEKTGRVVYACDVQPAFVAVALERYLEATGVMPVRLEMGVQVDAEGFARV